MEDGAKVSLSFRPCGGQRTALVADVVLTHKTTISGRMCPGNFVEGQLVAAS